MASQAEARALRKRQAEVHELIKGVAESPTGRALQSALQLPCKNVLDHAAASAVGILPGFIGLFVHSALALELLVGWLALDPVQLHLHSDVRFSSSTRRHLPDHNP